MGEFDLLRHIYASNSTMEGRIIIPPGDDMGMVSLAGSAVLAAVDQLIDGVHVRLETTPIGLVGRKAVARSVSDIAAMAARPLASLASVALPRGFEERLAVELFDAMRSAAAALGCPLMGGDIAVHAVAGHPLTCSVTVLAEAVSPGPIRRDGARAGDSVYVTGRLGGSCASDGSGRHLSFPPRVQESLELLGALGTRLHAMIDLSDGLGRDASHIAEQSGVQIILDAASIPCSGGCDWRQALRDGEDYELCFTATGPVPDHIGDVAISAVGTVVSCTTAAEPRVLVRSGESEVAADELGWQHEP